MRRFFTYESPYRTHDFIDLTPLEYVLPIILLGLLVFFLFKYKEFFRRDARFEKRFRYVVAVVFFIIYSSHYILRYNLYGFDTIILPFHLCSISMFLAIVLLFTKNNTIYTYVLFTGVLGGLVSLATPVIGYNSGFYRYYQFYIAHILLILTPIYFLLVHDMYPTKRYTINAFIILQSLATFMGVFNYVYGTDFMFIFVDPTKIEKFPLIRYFGGIPFYIIPMEIVAVFAFYGLYKVTNMIKNYHGESDKNYIMIGEEIHDSI